MFGLVFALMFLLQYFKITGAYFFINSWKIYHENFVLKEKSPNLENFDARNI